VDNRLMFLDAC